MRWYKSQKERDLRAQAASESLVGPLVEAFADLMSFTRDCLEAVFAQGAVEDTPTKAKVAIANHAFNLLWSAWQSGLAGRYSAASDHWRSIDDAPHFLVALRENPQLAHDLPNIDIRTALRTIKKGIEKLDRKKAREWFEQKTDEQKAVQPFAHLSVEATMATMTILADERGQRAIVGAGGVVSEHTLRHVALYLCKGAFDLAKAVVFTFQDIAEIDDAWEKTGRALLEEANNKLSRYADELGLDE